MLIPRFNLRTALVAIAGCAPVFLVLALGLRGQIWAWTLVASLVALGVTAAVHVMVYLFAWLAARYLDEAARRRPSLQPATVAAQSAANDRVGPTG